VHEGDGCLWYRIAVAAILLPVNRLVRHDWRHAQRLPRTGGAIVAANHLANADPLVLAWFVHGQGRQCHFLAKEGLFRVPVLGRLLAGAGQIPVHRGTPDAPLALRSAKEALEDGKCVILYPEGTITGDPDLWPMLARTGLARLALETDVPVLPVGQWGAHALLRDLVGRLRRGEGWRPTAAFSVGEPVDLSAFRGRPLTAGVLRGATEVVMEAVRREVVAVRGGTPPAVPFDPRPLRAVPGETARRWA
jgi:1-acyl-sn-glycerol-3-phosphate acyltransferase